MKPSQSLLKQVEKDNLKQVKAEIDAGLNIMEEFESSVTGGLLNLLEYASLFDAPRVIQFLVQSGMNPNKCKRIKPLVAACDGGNLQIAQLLIQNGADCNIKQSRWDDDDGGATPLIAASCTENIELVRFLLQAGADPNVVTKKGVTALTEPAERGDNTMLLLLLESGCRMFDGALLMPTYRGDLDIVRALINAGADVNVTGDKDHMYVASKTPLEIAMVERSNVDRKLELRKALASAKKGGPAILGADELKQNYLEIIKLLIKAGADVNRITLNRTPLYYAVELGDLETVDLLLVSGANARDAVSYSTLSKLSTGKGAKRVPGYYNSALHIAAEKGLQEIAKALVSSGADPDKVDDKGRTPREIATSAGNKKILEIL